MITIDASVLNELKSYVDNSLRDYQQHNKTEIYKKWESTNSVLLQMPTGTGKTRLFVSIINDLKQYGEAHDEKISILIITHRKELVDQITHELSNPKYGISPSLITPEDRYSHHNPKSVCVASIQTLSRRLYYWKNYHFDIVIIDEAHHSRGRTYHRVLRTYTDSKFLGVTATPYRLNDIGLAQEFDELIVSPPVKNFIEAGWLSNYDYYSIGEHNDLYEGLSSVPLDSYGDYSVNGLWRYCGKDRIRAEIVASYLKYAKGKKGIVYTINRAHNNQLCNEFQRCGIRAYGIDQSTRPETRADIVRRFREGKIDILCNVNIFTEGFDCPDVEFIQLARPTKSLGLYLQQVGRGLRIAPRKEKVIFLDNVGLHNRFGYPSSKRQWGRHFVGSTATEAGEKYAEQIDSEAPFEFNQRNPDLSEGCEEIKLIESTGVNEIIEETKSNYVETYASELKPIVESIFETNRKAYEELIVGYSEEHLFFKAVYKEDLLNPCPKYLFEVETDDMDYILEKMKKEFKPVVKYGILDYDEYNGWEDYSHTKGDMVYRRFRNFISRKNSDNLQKLNDYTVEQLRAFFETYYGDEHNMTIKLNDYCNDDITCEHKWGDAKNSWTMGRFPVRTKGLWGFNTEYKD